MAPTMSDDARPDHHREARAAFAEASLSSDPEVACQLHRLGELWRTLGLHAEAPLPADPPAPPAARSGTDDTYWD